MRKETNQSSKDDNDELDEFSREIDSLDLDEFGE